MSAGSVVEGCEGVFVYLPVGVLASDEMLFSLISASRGGDRVPGNLVVTGTL